MDNLISGIQTNEMAISYVQSLLQTTVEDLQYNLDHMLSLFTKQVQHSTHLNHELDELKVGILDLVKGKLSPLLIPTSVLKSTFNEIQNLLDKKYPGTYRQNQFKIYVQLTTSCMLDTITVYL